MQGGPDGRSDLRTSRMEQSLLEPRKCLKGGSNAFKDSEKRSSVATFCIYSVFPWDFELSLLKKLTILIHILIKPGFFKVSKYSDLL